MNRQDEQNDVLRDFTARLERMGIEYMLTGSMALVHYAVPRTTADIDIVLAIGSRDVSRFISEFDKDYYIPHNRVSDAVRRNTMFNVLNHATVIKIDCVVKKNDEFQRTAFSRRQRVNYAGDFYVWIITKEDLVLSKLKWAKNTRSEMQMRDVASIIRNPYDEEYVKLWAAKLRVEDFLKDCYNLLDQNYVDGYDA
ncbi:MAG: DUF6036 family nucleotidyltransferase [Pyrinomonadaceae bacterium]